MPAKTSRMIGVEIGTSTLKMAVCSGSGVKKMVVEKMPADLVREGQVVSPLAMTDFLKNVMKENNIRGGNAALVLPDGIGVIHAAKILGTPLKERVPGIDFATGLLSELEKTGGRLFLLGAKPGVADQAAENLKKKYPKLTICGTNDGYFKDSAPVVEKIKEAQADVAFVCLGAPKQERWIAEFGPQTGAHLMVGLGGVLDVYAGNVKRAPAIWQKMGLEWFYRLVHQPSRFGRMAKLPLFLVDAKKESKKRGKA